MLRTLPPVSANLPLVSRLDNIETAIDDLRDFNLAHISFVLIGNPKNINVMLRVINAFCAEPTTDSRLKALWIEEGEILDTVKTTLEELFEDSFEEEIDFDTIQSYTSIAGSDEPLSFLTKDPGSFNAMNIKQEMNNATLSSPPSSTEIT